MLSPDQIQMALHADRAVPLDVPSSQGPFGIEHVLNAVSQIPGAPVRPQPERQLKLLDCNSPHHEVAFNT